MHNTYAHTYLYTHYYEHTRFTPYEHLPLLRMHAHTHLIWILTKLPQAPRLQGFYDRAMGIGGRVAILPEVLEFL